MISGVVGGLADEPGRTPPGEGALRRMAGGAETMHISSAVWRRRPGACAARPAGDAGPQRAISPPRRRTTEHAGAPGSPCARRHRPVIAKPFCIARLFPRPARISYVGLKGFAIMAMRWAARRDRASRERTDAPASRGRVGPSRDPAPPGPTARALVPGRSGATGHRHSIPPSPSLGRTAPPPSIRSEPGPIP